MIDINSPTWHTVLRFIEREHANSVNNLISDRGSDQARGAIHLLERLRDLPSDPIERVVADDYI